MSKFLIENTYIVDAVKYGAGAVLNKQLKSGSGCSQRGNCFQNAVAQNNAPLESL